MKKFIIYLFIINALTFAQESAIPVESTEHAPNTETKTVLTQTGTVHNDANTAGAGATPSNIQKTTVSKSVPVTNAAASNMHTNVSAQTVKKAVVPAETKNSAVYTVPVQKKQVTEIIAADAALKDSVNISAMVQNQINAAASGEIKTSANFSETEKPVKEPVKAKTKKQEAGVFESVVKSLNDFNKKYLNVLLFILGSGAILSYFFGKRIISILFGKSKRTLKKNINQIRNEKPVFINNKKLYELRSKLAESNNIYDISEESIPGKARTMNVGKGEIMLAAKIKAFQLSKISK